MHKFLVLALTLVFVVTLVGCDPNSKSDSAKPQADKANTAVDSPKTDEPDDETVDSLDDDPEFTGIENAPAGSNSADAGAKTCTMHPDGNCPASCPNYKKP
jgi:hypothetical protein